MTNNTHKLQDFIPENKSVYAPLYERRTHEFFKQALNDPDCYIDIFDMTIDQETGDSRSTERKDGVSDYYDIMVRGGDDADSVYIEVEYLSNDQVNEVYFFLERLYIHNPLRVDLR